ncbi:DNA primase [Candidatus Woesearchaeota archaeon]|nr:DNA primase [Candidatus Woesearchaeota archaeon]
MAKISPVGAKYIVHTIINAEGVVEKPDVVGAIFGQTEGLLGNDLELRELQRSGRIGRIEVNLETRNGRTNGGIIVPSNLDKAETAVIAAALETIQRIGPCNSKVKVEKIEDVRISKRNFVIERAKELLRELTSSVLPDSQEITDVVEHSVRMMAAIEYGPDRLAAGPAIDESEEVILVEGRADVLNLLKHDIKNVIAVNGTSIPNTIKTLGSQKVLVAFVDGDRGGDLIVKGLIDAGIELDYVIRAPDGKEVEEITKKEIHKALRSRVTIEQVKLDFAQAAENANHLYEKPRIMSRPVLSQERPIENVQEKSVVKRLESVKTVQTDETRKFKSLLDDLVGTRGAFILDEKLDILGKVPTSELGGTIRNLKNAYAIVFDGYIDRNLVLTAERSNLKYLVAMDSRVRPGESRVKILTGKSF